MSPINSNKCKSLSCYSLKYDSLLPLDLQADGLNYHADAGILHGYLESLWKCDNPFVWHFTRKSTLRPSSNASGLRLGNQVGQKPLLSAGPVGYLVSSTANVNRMKKPMSLLLIWRTKFISFSAFTTVEIRQATPNDEFKYYGSKFVKPKRSTSLQQEYHLQFHCSFISSLLHFNVVWMNCDFSTDKTMRMATIPLKSTSRSNMKSLASGYIYRKGKNRNIGRLVNIGTKCQQAAK